MNLEEYLIQNLVKKVVPDFLQINMQLKRSRKDIVAAEKLAKSDKTWAYTICYHSMLRNARALMYANGYLPTNRNTHKTIVQYVSSQIGKEYSDIISKLGRMRRERHDFIYESKNGISTFQVTTAINYAKTLAKVIEKSINKINPQSSIME
ncbi:MAG: hypothetical protein A2452_07445 [Candidatus Firestonebacteria bacterium RIFOXYC2_FULL_39_67]|nr:MAG: hypothetical protein A2536_01660 [Candidatus Firestonebacteria bacterium RIFOXYD2_FULL_39_29]OGF51889.1 MAG: hypothetical protein A2497_00835 [Candidatus Firestonebacteria bacterium RifOxyC12_full_39_7]OGF55492.1 MAG: hypothetical protein A2452_07445 [Candidatus Firestonebacteria bacterium RIFOXYC2_FULL_39_67]